MDFEKLKKKFQQEYMPPPKNIGTWCYFAVVMTGLSFIVSMSQPAGSLDMLGTFVRPACCWAAVLATWLKKETGHHDYFKNIGQYELASAAACLMAGALPGHDPETDAAWFASVSHIMDTCLATALFCGVVWAFEKYIRDTKGGPRPWT